MKSGVVYKEDKDYPELLKKIAGAPKQLYWRGAYNKGIFENCLAVVGSRRLTEYGRRVAEKLVAEIAAAGVTVVSGFMYGGDAAAHAAALKVGGRTIAVMPCGADVVYPPSQKKLYEEILANRGLVLSEYEAGVKPTLWTFPQRNRIVAGLSQALLVLEASEKSGSLITANCAKKSGRKIFAAPGQVFSSVSRGTNLLIREGADMALSAEDILEFYEIKGYAIKEVAGTEASKFENKILAELGREPLSVDELSRILKKSAAELGAKLSLMQIKGIVLQRGNKYYVG